VKYRFTTKRKINKMKGGAGSWDCKCRDPIDGEISKLKPVTTAVSSAVSSAAPPMPAAAVLPAAAAAAAATAAMSSDKLAVAQQIALQRSSIMKNKLQLQLAQLLQQQKQLQEQGKALEPLLDNEIKKLQEQLMPRRRPQESRPLNVAETITPPPMPLRSPPTNVSNVLKRGMIREKDGTYQIDSRNKLPNGFIDGDIILSIDGYPASTDNINKLYGSDSANTAVVTVINNEGGTHKKGIRTITIQYS